MWWRKHSAAGHLARLAIVFAAAGLTAGCFEPLYANRPTAGIDNVHDKLAAVELAPATTKPGAPDARIAVGMHNALQYELTRRRRCQRTDAPSRGRRRSDRDFIHYRYYDRQADRADRRRHRRIINSLKSPPTRSC